METPSVGQKGAAGLEGSPTALGPSQDLLLPSFASQEGPMRKWGSMSLF